MGLPGGNAKRRCPSTSPPDGSTEPQAGRCAICNDTLLADRDRPQTPRDWEHWLATTRNMLDIVWDTANTDTTAPRPIHLHCNTTRQPPRLA